MEIMKRVKLSFHYAAVFYVFMAVAHICHASRSNHLNKVPVKSIKSPDGDIIDCFHISHQPAFDHPILKNHTIKTTPSYHPNWINGSKVGPPLQKHESISQLWHSNGKCSKGTIPIRRTKKEDALIAGSIKSYRKNRHNFHVAQPNAADARRGHEHAIVSTYGQFYGAKATLNLWNPKIQEPNEFSLTQLWILGGPDSDLNTIEAGWMAAPPVYGDYNTRLFIFWTSDGYEKTRCYNLQCGGFIQTNNEIALGGTLSTSQVDGSQNDITILVWKDPKEGDWWLQVGNGKALGYWPASLFTYLSQSASAIEWGGEVINTNTGGQHTSTQMGSGHFPQDGLGKASYIKDIQIVDESNSLKTPEGLNTYTTEKGCYDILISMNENSVLYGGPGRNPNCP